MTIKEGNGHFVLTDEDIRGPLKHGAKVEAKHPETGVYMEATINKITDSSTYTVGELCCKVIFYLITWICAKMYKGEKSKK